jgi:hypothetical protein
VLVLSTLREQIFTYRMYRMRQRNGRLLEPVFSGTAVVGAEECFRKGEGHLEDVVFRT